MKPDQQTHLGKTIRTDFPFFANNPNQAFLDSAASALTAQPVIDAIDSYYQNYSVNIHRGVYKASAESTKIYEESRNSTRTFLGASASDDIVFVRNATEGFNLLANSLALVKNELTDFFPAWSSGLSKDDIILISESEHHSNIVPWQMIAKRTRAVVRYVPIVKETGALDVDAFLEMKKEIVSSESVVKIVSLSKTSNVSGIIHDLSFFREFAREQGAIFIVDGAQSVCHLKTNFTDSDYDFFLFSGHKLIGPTGIGVLCGSHDLLNVMPPFMGGGDMILSVGKEETLFNESPHRFEAGTPHIAGVFGLQAAIQYIANIGLENIKQWEDSLVEYAIPALEKLGARIYGPNLEQANELKIERVGAISFGLENIHPHDMGTILDKYHVAIRTGHHCCQVLMNAWAVAATNRASIYFYNDKDDIDMLIEAIEQAKKVFKV